MKMKKLNYQKIDYQRKQYSLSLKQSIQRIGLSFPIKVKYDGEKYTCVDGNKRLSVIFDLLKENKYSNLESVVVIVVNDGSTRSNDCWRKRNTH